MNKTDLHIAQEVKNRLKKNVNLVRLKAFGSRARGDNNWDSDLDLYIEVRNIDKDIRNKISEILWEVGFEHGVVISPIVVTTAEVTETALRSSSIIKNIDKAAIQI